jgi:hypothetical protein
MRHAELTDLQLTKIVSAIGNRYGIIEDISKFSEERFYYWLRYPIQENHQRLKLGIVYDPTFEIIEIRIVEPGCDINDGKMIGFAHVSSDGNLDIEIENKERYENYE